MPRTDLRPQPSVVSLRQLELQTGGTGLCDVDHGLLVLATIWLDFHTALN
jgi:hypothetical protein